MPAVMQRILDRVLSAIRARREEAGGPGISFPSKAAPLHSPRLRRADFSDYEQVVDLKKRWGLIPESYENWKRFWLQNPALRDAPEGRAIGWVLETEGKLVGYLGNISSSCQFGSQTLTAVISSGLVVEPEYRSLSATLIAAFYRQKSDLYLSTTAIPATGKMAMAFKSEPLPQPEYDTVLFWVLRPYGFVKAVIDKIHLHPALAQAVVLPACLGLKIEKLFNRREPKRGTTTLPVREISVDEIGEDFQSLWQAKLGEGARLISDRAPEVLRWHFTIPGDSGVTNVILCEMGKELLGYAVIRSAKNRATGLKRTLIADILVKNDNPEVTRRLLAAAYEKANLLGSHTLEVLGFPDSIRRIFFEGNPHKRKYPAMPYYYKALDPVLHRTLLDGFVWYATPFDGDTTLMP